MGCEGLDGSDTLKPVGRHNNSDGGVSPSGNENPEFLFPFIFPFAKSPLGRHNDSDGSVSLSENSRFNRGEVLTLNRFFCGCNYILTQQEMLFTVFYFQS